MNNNKWSRPGLKIVIQKQHPVLHSSSLKPCLLIQWAPGAEDTDAEVSELPCLFHSSSLFLQSLADLIAFPFPVSPIAHSTVKLLLFLNPLLELSVSLAHFLSELFLPFRLTPTLLLMRKIWLRDMRCWPCCLPARPQNSGAWPLEMKSNTAILSSV